jgi:hypothetical protein
MAAVGGFRLGASARFDNLHEFFHNIGAEFRLNNKMGAQGWTEVYLARADEALLKSAPTLAWRNVTTKMLQATLTG